MSVVGGGTLFFLPATARAARGIPSCSVLFLDEAAFLEGAQDIYSAAMPTLSMVGEDAKVIMVSTPGIETDFFGDLWLTNEGDWNKQEIHYSQHPVYSKDPEWAAKTRISRRMTQSAWNQEYELMFGATDTQVYPTKLVDKCATGKLQECGLINRSYVFGIDPAAGGADAFVVIVLDITDPQCAEVVQIHQETGKSTDYNLKKVAQLVEDWMPGQIAVEKNGIGQVIGEALINFFPGSMIELRNTSRPSKITDTDRILYLMEKDGIRYPNGPLVTEMKAFRQNETGGREAAPGYHDDLVMALAQAVALMPEVVPTASFFDQI